MLRLALKARRGSWDLRHGETGDRRRDVGGFRRQGGRMAGVGVGMGMGVVVGSMSTPAATAVAVHAEQTGMLWHTACQGGWGRRGRR